MKNWQIVVPGLLGLALAGCHNDPSIALLERDNYNKEQEIFRLQNRVEDLEEALNSGSPQPRVVTHGALPKEMLSEPGTTDGGRFGSPATRPGSQFTAPDRPNSESETPLPGGLNISPGIEGSPGEIPERMRLPGENAPPPPFSPPGRPSSGDSHGGPSPGRSTQWSPIGSQSPIRNSGLGDNSAVFQVTLHPALTGGIGTGGPVGDQGLLVVVEPRDLSGNILSLPGDINVALFDPALSGEQARLARWDFVAAETEGMVRTGSQPGIHLRLPWKSTPAHDRLKVFVRYTTRDGRKLQTERLISVAVNGPAPAPLEAAPDAAPAQTASRPQRPEWSPVR
jgi:hypothetical protein